MSTTDDNKPEPPRPPDAGCSAVMVKAFLVVNYRGGDRDGCYLLAEREIGRSSFVPRVGEVVSGIAGEDELIVEKVDWSPMANEVMLTLKFEAKCPGYEQADWEEMGWEVIQDIG